MIMIIAASTGKWSPREGQRIFSVSAVRWTVRMLLWDVDPSSRREADGKETDGGSVPGIIKYKETVLQGKFSLRFSRFLVAFPKALY